MSRAQLEAELLHLVAKYNKHTGRYLLVYSAALDKPIPSVPLSTQDYYVIADILRPIKKKALDFYVETPGGSGEAAEQIVEHLHSRFEEVNIVVSGEAKSAGTLMALGGNNISMTETGSLGPIDAQVVIGRGQVSAHDYMEWVKTKQEQAGKEGRLSPFDATMVAQISPGELIGVHNALEFAHELVVKWLPVYKFRRWRKTETHGVPVTGELKRARAREIAEALSNHSKWRSHGRSLRISDLEKVGLKINKIDDDSVLAEIVYSIQTVIKLLFLKSNSYKIFATADSKIFASAVAVSQPISSGGAAPAVARIEIECSQCKTKHKLYAKLKPDPSINAQMREEGYTQLPADNHLICECGNDLDLSGARDEIEATAGEILE